MFQNVTVTPMVRLLCNVMPMVIALVKMDLMAKHVMLVKRDSLVTNVMNANQTTLIIHHVKVCLNNWIFKKIKLIPSYVSECNCNPDGSTTLQCDGNGDCTCKDGYSGSKCVKCEAPLSYIGDKECDDITNNAECNFDGGDCCMDVVSTEYCTECICKQ